MFSKSCKYALRAVLLLSTAQDTSTKLGAKRISEELEVPQPFLAKILQELSRKGVISSTKGLKGGFFLSDVDAKGNLYRVVEVIDGGGVFENCTLGLPECGGENPCPLHHKIVNHRKALVDLFKKNTIADMADMIKKGKFKI